MARLSLTKAITYTDAGYFFRRGIPQEITNEGDYHLLVRSGKVFDPDKPWDFIAPEPTLPKLEPGTVVTVVREMGLGDVLMSLVVIKALANRWPKLQFQLATGRSYLPVIGRPSFLADVQCLMDWRGPLRNVIELRGLAERSELRKNVDRIDIFAKYCGVQISDYTIPIQTTEAEREAGRRLLCGAPRTIVLTVRGSTPIRSWTMEHVKEFAALAVADGWTVALVDQERFSDPETRPGLLNLTGIISLAEVKSLIAAADFCIAPDTGLVHLAEAVGTRCLALYTTTPPALRVGHYRHVKALWRSDLACSPCFDRGCKPIYCASGISPEAVLRAIKTWDELGRETNPRTFAVVPATA